jgi:hypothetical protein
MRGEGRGVEVVDGVVNLVVINLVDVKVVRELCPGEMMRAAGLLLLSETCYCYWREVVSGSFSATVMAHHGPLP